MPQMAGVARRPGIAGKTVQLTLAIFLTSPYHNLLFTLFGTRALVKLAFMGNVADGSGEAERGDSDRR